MSIQRAVVGRWGRAAAVLGDVGLAVGIAMMVPLVVIVLGAPVVLLVRAILAIAERF